MTRQEFVREIFSLAETRRLEPNTAALAVALGDRVGTTDRSLLFPCLSLAAKYYADDWDSLPSSSLEFSLLPPDLALSPPPWSTALVALFSLLCPGGRGGDGLFDLFRLLSSSLPACRPSALLVALLLLERRGRLSSRFAEEARRGRMISRLLRLWHRSGALSSPGEFVDRLCRVKRGEDLSLPPEEEIVLPRPVPNRRLGEK